MDEPLRLPEGSWWDWEIVECNGGVLRLAAGYDLTYHHGLEVVFTDPRYVQLPVSFQDPVFRTATARERDLVTAAVGEAPPVLVALDVDAPGAQRAPACLIAAEEVAVVRGSFARGSVTP